MKIYYFSTLVRGGPENTLRLPLVGGGRVPEGLAILEPSGRILRPFWAPSASGQLGYESIV